MMRGFITYSLLLFTLVSFAQEKKKKDVYLPKGNKEFMEKNYAEAEANFRISQSNSPTKSAAAYNLGNSIYRQGQPAEAAYAYFNAIKNAQTKQQKHMAYHNLGNVMMKEKNYQAAVEAYKNALRNNPADEETRYNFALAKKMLKDNPPPKQDPKQDEKQKQDNKSQQPKDNKGDNKDKQDQGDQKDKGDKGDEKEKKPKEGDKQQEKQNNDKGKPEEKEGPSPSKQRMENLLDAMNNEEKKIQEKIQAKKVKVQPRKHEKDW